MLPTASKYIRENFEEQDRLAVVLIDRNNGSVQQRLLSAGDIIKERFQSYLRASNASGKDVYISMNALSSQAQGRTKNDIDQIRHVYLDIDTGGRRALDAVLNCEDVPKPHHVLNTSPDKFQVVWRVNGFEKDQAEQLLRKMAAAHNADPAATDCSRVLRIPGFRNCKYEAPFYVKEIEVPAANARAYNPADFLAYEELGRGKLAERGPVTEPLVRSTGKSHSEKDFAYVRRALERGERPSNLIAKVARFRADKSNPQYYAERTVERAMQAHIRDTRRLQPSADVDSSERAPSR